MKGENAAYINYHVTYICPVRIKKKDAHFNSVTLIACASWLQYNLLQITSMTSVRYSGTFDK